MTTKLSAGDWIRLQRLKASRQYLANDQDINPPVNAQLPYSKAMLIPPTVGTSKYRRMASQWIDYKASQTADYIIGTTKVRLCDCTSSTVQTKVGNCVCVKPTHNRIR